ncbi:MAG: hypothetical protein ACI9H8_001326 [Lysobacterales bacterium]|jgi:hypothetical protein
MLKIIHLLLIPMLSLSILDVQAGSFRCGTRLVKTGDSVSRLVDACGKPSLKYKSEEAVRKSGNRKITSVTNWVYERKSNKNMVVSIHSGIIVKIATD